MVTWNCLCTTPATQKHPLFMQIITSYITLTEIASTVSLAFAPSLYDTLNATILPSVSFLRLPTEIDRRWAVYMLLLEKLFITDYHSLPVAAI
jgi:hypothetical protein